MLLIIAMIYKGRPHEGFSDTHIDIPKVIYTYWNSDDPPKTVKLCMESWKKYNPEFEIVLLTPSNLKKYTDVDVKALKWNDSSAREADIVRLLVLETHGGVWCDSSIMMLEPLDLDHNKSFVAYYISSFTTDDRYPVIENWFFATIPNNPFMKRWKEAFFMLGKFKKVDDAVQHIKDKGVDLQKIDNPNYLFMHFAAQYVMQKQMTPREVNETIHVMKAEDGPFKYLANNTWGSYDALNDLCKGNNVTGLIKFRGGERGILEKDHKLRECIFLQAGV
jgi:hypothetical protein